MTSSTVEKVLVVSSTCTRPVSQVDSRPEKKVELLQSTSLSIAREPPAAAGTRGEVSPVQGRSPRLHACETRHRAKPEPEPFGQRLLTIAGRDGDRPARLLVNRSGCHLRQAHGRQLPDCAASSTPALVLLRSLGPVAVLGKRVPGAHTAARSTKVNLEHALQLQAVSGCLRARLRGWAPGVALGGCGVCCCSGCWCCAGASGRVHSRVRVVAHGQASRRQCLHLLET